MKDTHSNLPHSAAGCPAPEGCAAQALAYADGMPVERQKEAPAVRFWRDAALDAVEVRYAHFNGYRFPPHVHDTWSVGLIDAGHCVFRLGERDCSVGAGQVAIIPPGVVHQCNPAVGTWTYRMFYVHDDYIRQLTQGLSGSSGYDAAGSGRDAVTFAAPVLQDTELFSLLSDCQQLLCEDAVPLAKQSAMTGAFSLLLSRHAAVRDESSGHMEERRAVRRVREYLAAHLDDKVTLDDLAAVAGLSGYHLLRVFRAEAGLTPHQWQTQLRINKARVLLAQGMDIAETAVATGFTDQSHFTRTFRSVMGATPRVYQQAGI